MLYTNANDLKNKLSELSIVASTNNCKVLGITETMFHNELLEAEVSIANFKLYRVDRQSKKGGGVCLYVHNTIESEAIDLEIEDCVAVKLTTDSVNVVIVNVYHSPSLAFSASKTMINQLSDIITEYKRDNEIIMFGDFNLPDVLWDEGVVNCPMNTSNKKFLIQRLFLDLFVKHNLSWAIGDDVKTRRRQVLDDIQSATLDNVLVSDMNLLKDVQVTAPLGKSDHIGLLCSVIVGNDENYLNLDKKNWARFGNEEIYEAAKKIAWTRNDSHGIEDVWDNLHSKLMEISEKVPTVTTRVTHSGAVKTRSPWDRPFLIKSRKKKEKSWAVFENFPNAENFRAANFDQGAFERCQTRAMRKFEHVAASQIKTNPKAFYNYMNSKRKIKAAITGLKDSKGRPLRSALDVANTLGEFFESTFVKEETNGYPTIADRVSRDCDISDLKFDAKIVRDLLLKLNTFKSLGPDNVHPKLLKALAMKHDFVMLVTDLFQKCFDSGTLPSAWKTANVTALHKKGDKCLASNYRPISLTCILSKIFEKLLRNHILEYVSRSIVEQQHGFLPGRSCVSNLLECMDIVSDAISEKNGAVDILYLDFQKAFDSVPHERLLYKLQSYGIRGKTLSIIADFLDQRTFRVRVGGVFSESFPVTSGVPQGTVLGPLLFILFINDLPSGMKSFVSLFADDLKLVTKVSLHSIAQEDLDTLCKWEKDWLLKFNVKDGKCKVLHIGPNNPQYDYMMNGSNLPKVKSEKDLGVYTCDDLSWGLHIRKAVNKAKSVIGWITRSIISRNKFVMLNVYKTLVRPHVEYAVQVWNIPAAHGSWAIIMEIEDVQRSFTRLIDGIGLKPYNERLRILGLTTLLERRMRGDLIETFKVTTGKVEYGQNLFRMSRSGAKILKDNRGDTILSNRVANYWNKLPQCVKDSSSVECFKSRLQSFKLESITKGDQCDGNFWDLSVLLLSKINDCNRDDYVTFMIENPEIARIKKVNVRLRDVE